MKRQPQSSPVSSGSPTSKKLWLGFGALSALLVLAGVAILMRVGSIEGLVWEQGYVTRTRAAATSELEINVLDFSLAVQAHLPSVGAELRGTREGAVKEAAEVERNFREYERLATTDRQREMATRFLPLWHELQALGQALLDAETRQRTPEDAKRFHDLQVSLEKLLDEEMQVDASETYNAHRHATMQDVRGISGFILILLIGGIVIAATTSIAVGRSIIKTDRSVRESRELLRVTLASIGDAVIATDAQGRINYLNAVAESLTGWKDVEAAGQPLDAVFRIVNEESRKPAENPVKKVLTTGHVVGMANHTALIARDGTERPIDDSAAPIRKVNGEVAGVVLIFRDVTEQRRASRAAAILAAIVTTSDDAIISKNLDGVITSWNKGAERIFGFSAEEIIGKPVTLLIPDDHLDEEPRILQRIQLGELIDHFETVRKRKDGTLLDISLTVSPLKDATGRIVGASKIARDITVRKQAEQALRESEQRFHTLFTSAPVAIFVCDRNAVIQHYNQRAVELWGREPVCGVEKHWGSIKLWLPDGTPLPHARSPMVEVLRTGVPAHNVELHIERPDGSRLPALVNFAPLKNTRGDISGAITSFIDITERTRMEDQLRNAAAHLSEADRRKNEFLGTLAHELRNPLAPIRNMLEIMKRTDGDGETIQEARAVMDRQLGQMVRLVDDLLDVSRISRDKIKLRTERVELSSIVYHAVEACRPLVDCAHHQLTVTLPREPVFLNADPVRLSQIFGNLLSNACKYTKPQGRIWLTGQRQDREVVVSVKDTGVGIESDMLPRIFEMFTQVDHSLERSQGGLGIGLTLVQRLVELHGGSIKATSEGLERGSEFVVRLPILIESPKPSPPTPIVGGQPAVTGRRVLVVDDNLDAARSMAMVMKLEGHETFVAHDGLEAVAAADSFRPDVVLLDIGLPKLNGFGVCRKIREQPWGKSIVLIALTGWGQEDDRSKSKEAGFDAHLVKPVEHDELTNLLAKLLAAQSPEGAATR